MNYPNDFLKEVAKVIYEHKPEFEDYKIRSAKLAAVKALKDYTGGMLKECKEAYEMWYDGFLPPYLIEERRKKLEQLAKKPLIEEIILKLRKIEDEKLVDILIKLSIDELLSIDEKFEN